MSRTKRRTAVLLSVAVLVAAVAWWYGGWRYPEVTSAENLHLVKALYTACSSRSVERLAAVEQALVEGREAGQIGDDEWRAFQAIIAHAKQERWQKAAEESYRFAKHQLR